MAGHSAHTSHGEALPAVILDEHCLAAGGDSAATMHLELERTDVGAHDTNYYVLCLLCTAAS